jgi:hypothetical protein
MTTGRTYPFPLKKPPSSYPIIGVVVLMMARVAITLGFAGKAALLGLAGATVIYALTSSGVIDGTYPEGSRPLSTREAVIFGAPFLLLGILGFLIDPVGKRLLYFGRKLRAKDALKMLQQDRRRPILFLRSFSDDHIDDPTLTTPFEWKRHRYEERLTQVLGKIGPVVCLGRPGERLSEAGAGRLYTDDDHWQEAIIHFLKESRMVIIIVGGTDGLQWEIETALSTARLSKVLFFFPYSATSNFKESVSKRFVQWILRTHLPTKESYRLMENERQSRFHAFCDHFQPLLNWKLPDGLGKEQFLYFSHEGKPKLLPSRRPISSALAAPFQKQWNTHIIFSRTLRPFLKKLSKK